MTKAATPKIILMIMNTTVNVGKMINALGRQGICKDGLEEQSCLGRLQCRRRNQEESEDRDWTTKPRWAFDMNFL